MQGNGTTPRVQLSLDWMDFAADTDVTLWLEVRAIGNPASGLINLAYETSPTRDETLFRGVATLQLAVTPRPVVTKIRLADNPEVPFARWLRWKLTATAAGDWWVTFRVFAVPGRAVTALTSFDPASLSLSGWWRAPYAGSPWRGDPSLGFSSARDLFETTNPPSLGAAVNGYVPADYDGTNDMLRSGTLTLADVFAETAYSGWALVNIDTINTNNPTIYENDCIFSSTPSAFVLIFLRSTGIVGFRHHSTVLAVDITTAFTTGAWHFVQWKYDGTHMKLRVDSNAWVSAAATARHAGGNTNTFFIGANYAPNQYVDGKLLEVATSNVAFADATFDTIKGYVNTRYALSL